MPANVARFELRREPPPDPTFAFVPEVHPMSFVEKYRPRTVAELAGQPAVVAQLRTFLAAPYPCALMLEGPTGVGKTSAALALARDLKVDMAANFFHVKSGCQDGAVVASIIDTLRFCPWGDGWRLILVDEADLMTDLARKLWLSALESIPGRTVLIFTTNHPGRFDQRTLDRFRRLAFASTGPDTLAAAQSLADMIWQAETGGEDGPEALGLPNVLEAGTVSFRRLASALESVIRFGMPSRKPATAATPDGPAESPAPAAPDNPSPSLAERRHNAAVKAHATRKRNAAAALNKGA